MEKLKDIIGLAPSELSRERLMELVEREARRMERVLQAAPKPRRRKAAKAPKAQTKRSSTRVSRNKLKQISELTGVPLEDLLK